MKNLLIISSRYPHSKDKISTTFVYSQVEELRKYFDKVVVIALTPYTPSFTTKLMQPKRKYDALARDYSYENVDVYFTKNIYLPKGMFINKRGWQGYRSASKILSKINFKPDLIHAHFIWPSGFVGMKLKENDIPLIITGHGYDVYELAFIYDSLTENIKKALSAADRVITVSTKNRDVLIEKLGVPENKIKIIPNGYNPELFSLKDKQKSRKKLSLPEDAKIVISVGKLHPVKGFDNLIRSAKMLEKDDMKFYIIGDGPEMDNLSNMIKELSLEKNVKLIGNRSHDEIPDWIAASDIFVLPSRSEGNPTVMFEALGCGKPFIGTDVGGVTDIIKDEKIGLVVKRDDPGELAGAIKTALGKKWDGKYIHEFSKQYTWENIVKEIVRIYKEVLNKTN